MSLLLAFADGTGFGQNKTQAPYVRKKPDSCESGLTIVIVHYLLDCREELVRQFRPVHGDRQDILCDTDKLNFLAGFSLPA